MKHKKILPKAHSGKLVHHRHTSYSALIGVLLMAFMPLFVMSREVAVAAPGDPVETAYSTHAVVPAPIPRVPPVISTPGQGTVIDGGGPLRVEGSCPDGMLIKIFKNGVLAGAVFCDGGRYSVDIDPFIGPNALTARAYNANNIAGPESEVVTIRREVGGSPGGAGAGAVAVEPLLIKSEAEFKGISVGEKLTWPLSISGGKAPYAISISWGDGKTDLISRSQPGPFEVSHTYERGGEGVNNSVDITILATDEAGTKSFMHLVTIVSGNEPTVVGSIKAGYNWSGALKIAWQLIMLGLLIVVSFWLGEKREAFLIKRKAKTA